MDPRRSPLWVFLAHASNEIAQLATDLWPPCPLSRLPAPERRETRTMPANKGSGMSLIQDLRDENIRAIKVDPEGDKVMRMNAQTALFEAGSVSLPRSAG